ncbi:chromosome partitioning protein [Catalinimonas alkaloidigena]|uniref:Chromosome partitioning protein n=1 Tax=Catalinimonas alkaloidigena TaxID=1075417 RepID=A0A1G9U295_9BACT|nr:ParA family protein [Catalinimonas alkaloidigena]SDM54026.1 chromosome partitioning protein [Catalinimonas alkaloidigena]
MNIIIANQKGGAGKSTHCILLANYLVLEKKKQVLVLDLDFQSSVKDLWDQDRANYADTPPLYEVINKELSEIGEVLQMLQGIGDDQIILFDLPGYINDNALVPVFEQADLVICPFAYDKITFESTYVFAQVLRRLNESAPVVFLPNRLKSSVKYATIEQVNEALGTLGAVAPALPDKVAYQRIDTQTIPKDIQEELNASYEYILEKYSNK